MGKIPNSGLCLYKIGFLSKMEHDFLFFRILILNDSINYY